jgi:hypothetical protein
LQQTNTLPHRFASHALSRVVAAGQASRCTAKRAAAGAADSSAVLDSRMRSKVRRTPTGDSDVGVATDGSLEFGSHRGAMHSARASAAFAFPVPFAGSRREIRRRR